MKDNQKKYLDKVTELIVRDMVIDYDNKTLTFPFYSSHLLSFFSIFIFTPTNLSISLFFSFSRYCKDTYGIVDDEIQYVWNQYRVIINDIIEDIY